MSVMLKPLAPRYAVSEADDPFKLYWWAILLGIACTGLWLLTPMLGEKAVGSTSFDAGKPRFDANVEQSLAADAGEDGYLSMDGTGRARKEDGPLVSSLYQAPEDEPEDAMAGAAAAPGAAKAGATLASALKKVSEGKGGWSEKAQRGFNAPKLAGGSLSGMGAASGGRSGSSSGSGAFGSSNANVGFAGAKGFSGGGSDAAAPNSKGIAALRAASAQSLLAAANRSNDGARSALSQTFDGSKGGSSIGGGGTALAGSYAALDAAPVNLKMSDPKLNEKKIEPPPGADAGASAMDESDMFKQIAMSMAAAALGAAIGGPVGGIVSSSIMKAVEMQEEQARKVRELEEQQQLDRARRRMG